MSVQSKFAEIALDPQKRKNVSVLDVLFSSKFTLMCVKNKINVLLNILKKGTFIWKQFHSKPTQLVSLTLCKSKVMLIKRASISFHSGNNRQLPWIRKCGCYHLLPQQKRWEHTCTTDAEHGFVTWEFGNSDVRRCSSLELTPKKKRRAFDPKFLRQLLALIKIMVPGVFSKEAGIIGACLIPLRLVYGRKLQ